MPLTSLFPAYSLILIVLAALHHLVALFNWAPFHASAFSKALQGHLDLWEIMVDGGGPRRRHGALTSSAVNVKISAAA